MRYVLEVEKTGSISQAAENLFMGQPNLSKSIKELELSLGIRIFKRTSRGVSATVSGEKFIGEIKRIMEQIEAVETCYSLKSNGIQRLSVSVPHCWRFANAFSAFVRGLDAGQEMELSFRETDSFKAISNVVEDGRHIGIIRYPVQCEAYFMQLLAEKSLQYQVLQEFESRILMSRSNPLAEREWIEMGDLESLIEVSYGGCVMSNPSIKGQCRLCGSVNGKKIRVFDRSSQIELLMGNSDTFMWSAFVPPEILAQNNLVQKSCRDLENRCKDVLIFPRGYLTNSLEDSFLKVLNQEVTKTKM